MSEGLKVQYQILFELKKVEEKIARLQSEASRIPAEIAKVDESISGKREDYQKRKSQFEANEKNLRKIEQDLKAKEDSLHKAEGKMMEVKTNEEYTAAIKENQSQKDEKSKLEDQVLTLINNTEEERKKLKEIEKEFKSFETALNEDKKKLEEAREKVLKQIEEQSETRSGIVGKLSREVADIYSKVTARAKGVPIVVAQNGMCPACNMKIRPQLYNEVLGFKAIHICPTCRRILIIAPPESGGSETMGEISS